MTLKTVLLLLIGLSALAWLVTLATFINETFKALFLFVLLVIAVVVLLQFAGVWQTLMSFHF